MAQITSKQIAQGLSTLEAVLTYGVDGLAEQLKHTATLSALGLTPDVFFDELYISRPVHEHQLLNQLRGAPTHTIAIAPIGWGKSTLIHKVIRQYTRESGSPMVLVDFKSVQRSFDNIDDLSKYISDQIKQQLYDDLSRRPECIGATDIDRLSNAVLLISDDLITHYQQGMSSDVSNCVRELLPLFQYSPESASGMGFIQWLRMLRSVESHPQKLEVGRIIAKLQNAMDDRDVLLSYRRIVSPQAELAKIVVAFDNVDQVSDFRNLEFLDQWLKRAVAGAALFQAVVAIRPENRALLQQHNHSGLFAEDAANIQKLPFFNTDLDPQVVEEWKKFIEEQDVLLDIDGKNFEALHPDDLNLLIFEDMIHVRRLEFVERAVTTGTVNGVSRDDLRAVSAAAREIHRVRTISLNMKCMANGNLRVKWAGVSNLLEYIVSLLRLEWANIGKIPATKQTTESPHRATHRYGALRSLYFRFLGSSPDLGGQPPVFHCSVFDPVKCVNDCGWDRGQMLATTSREVVEHCRTVLVNMAIFNACGNTRYSREEFVVPISKIISICEAMGLTARSVIDVIHHSVRHVGHRFSGMFSIENYVRIRDKEEDAKPTYRIASTPRLHQIMTSSAFTLGYLCERIAENQFPGVDFINDPVARQLAHRGLVPCQLISELPYWLAKAMAVEARWVEMMQLDLLHEGGLPSAAFKRYVDDFTVRDSHGSAASVFTQRIARSCAFYIRHIAIHLIDSDSEAELHSAYVQAVRQLDFLNRKLNDAVHASVKGDTWIIPRDRAIDIKNL
jgi:hypothetical protein